MATVQEIQALKETCESLKRTLERAEGALEQMKKTYGVDASLDELREKLKYVTAVREKLEKELDAKLKKFREEYRERVG